MAVTASLATIVLLGDVSPVFAAAPALLVLLVLLAAVAVFWWLRRGRARLDGRTPAPLDAEQRPDTTLRRIEVDAPVQITESMSLREIKDARAARLTGGYRPTAETEAELARRRAGTRGTGAVGATEAAVAVDPAPTPVPSAAVDAGPSTAPALVAPEDLGAAPVVAPDAAVLPSAAPPAPRSLAPGSASGRSMADGLSRTRSGFSSRLGALFRRPQLDDALLEELEEVLLTADIGPRTSQKLLGLVQERAASGKVDASEAWQTLRDSIGDMLTRNARPLALPAREGPTVLLVVGVNGAGKTTTIGKLAARFLQQGRKVAIVAGDTFRAAAVDQLAEWGARVGCPVFRGAEDADPSGVIYEGIRQAITDGIEIVLCDTAGRLQTKKPLMDELGKIGRSIAKAIPGAPHETILVLDANTGQNALQQARLFSEVTPVTGIVLTKLDGTAKGGVVIGISDELGIPIYFAGVGEAVEDLRPFDAAEFADALF